MNQIRPNSQLAIASLVSGILGWTLVPFIGTLVAIITGHMARREIRRSNGQLGGDGMAIAGLVLGWISAALWIVGIVIIFTVLGGLAWFAKMNS